MIVIAEFYHMHIIGTRNLSCTHVSGLDAWALGPLPLHVIAEF